jgi:hypothetical protein
VYAIDSNGSFDISMIPLRPSLAYIGARHSAHDVGDSVFAARHSLHWSVSSLHSGAH